MVSQLALLRARALLRTGRPDEAITVVRNVFIAHGTLDASLTARMLLGTAYVRCGDNRDGLEILEAAYRASDRAHPTIRSEIALNIGLAHYGLRNHDEADRVLELVSPNADIIHARSLEYRGWVAIARSEYVVASKHFEAALHRLDQCRQYDRFLEAHAVQALAILAAERLDRTSWLLVEDRARRIEWSAPGLAAPWWGVAISASMMEEVNGRISEALQWAREAEDVAVNEALRLFATCRRAAVLRTVGERFAHRDLVARIRAEVQRLDVTRLENEERRLMLSLAIETASVGDVLGARALLKQYDDFPPGSSMLSLTGDPRELGARHFAEAVVADAGTEHALAHDRYREAFQIFNRIGYERRALLAALRLGELTGQTYLFEYVDRTLRKLSSRSPLLERARRHNPAHTDPVVANLSRTERAVLELLCDGKSTLEIAAARGRSKQTIRNTISRILTAFEVSDRPALLRECMRRGIYAAS